MGRFFGRGLAGPGPGLKGQPAQRRRPSSLFRPPVDREVDDELEFHLEMRAREYEARGLDPAAARVAARKNFGDLEAARRSCRRIAKGRDRDERRREWWGELRQDTVFALRPMGKSRGFTAVAVFTLALGIGATTAVYSVLHAVVLQPLPYADPNRLLGIGTTWQGSPGGVSAGNYLYIQERQRSFESLAAVHYTTFNLNDDDSPERVIGARVSHEFFPIFGIAPRYGRAFAPEEDVPGRDEVVVLSDRLWRRRFAGDPGVVGRRIRISGVSREVVGVMPAAFDATADGEELWVPIAFTAERRVMHDDHFLNVYGRLRPGVSLSLANRDLARVAADLSRDHPRANQGRGAEAWFVADEIVGDYAQRLTVLLGAVGLVLLIACGNVANLLLGRGAARAKELAVRAALGAGRGRIVRQLLTESLLLAALGAGAGLAVAWAGLQAFLAAAPSGVPRLEGARLLGAPVGFAVAVTILASLVFGLAPAIAATRSELRRGLNEAGRTATAAPGRDRLRGVLVVMEVALALTLLVGAGLLVRTGINLGRADLGFDPQGLLTARLSLPRAAYPGHEKPARALEAFRDRVAARAGAHAAVALASRLPLVAGRPSNGLRPEGRGADIKDAIDSDLGIVTPGYHETLRIPLRKGRLFDADDRRPAPRVMIINEELARVAFPGQDPVGKRIACCEGGPDQPSWKVVVGVVANVPGPSPAAPVRPQFYLPLDQMPAESWDWIGRTVIVVVRSESAPAALAPILREAARAMDTTVPLHDVRTMADRRRATTAEQRFGAVLLSVLGGVGLVLAAVGIYGVIAYFVTQRTREIAVRLAVGASRRDVVHLVLGQGLRPVLAGLAVGLVGALAAGRALKAVLYGVTMADPWTLSLPWSFCCSRWPPLPASCRRAEPRVWTPPGPWPRPNAARTPTPGRECVGQAFCRRIRPSP